MDNANTANAKKKTDEIKQAFLSSAISDISAYIQLADTKVSIIMAAAVALIVGLFACYEPIGKLIASVKPCSWQGGGSFGFGCITCCEYHQCVCVWYLDNSKPCVKNWL